MKEIFFATDFSERSDRALRRATLLARRSGARLTLIHVVDDDRPARIVDGEQDIAAQLLREQAKTLHDLDGLSCTTKVVLAAPAAGIATTANASACDLLVLGQHRRQLLKDVFVGTTVERTIGQVECPVLVVNASPVGEYRQVLMATDLSDASRRAAERATALGVTAGAGISLLHVFDVPAVRLATGRALTGDARQDILYSERKNALKQLSDFARSLDLAHPTPLVRHEDTTAANEITLAAGEASADLIVVGTRGRTGIEKLLLGSVAEGVLRRADCDVLTVPPDARRKD